MIKIEQILMEYDVRVNAIDNLEVLVYHDELERLIVYIILRQSDLQELEENNIDKVD